MGHHHHHHHGHHHQEQQLQSYAGYGAAPPPASFYPPPAPSAYSAMPMQSIMPMQPYGYSAPDPYGYAIQPSPYAAAPLTTPYSDPYNPAYNQQDQLNHAIADRHRHGRNEHVGEMGVVAAGAFAMYEAHEAKVDPAHARRHKLEAEMAGAVAVGSAGYAFHEHHAKKQDEHLISSLGSQGHHHHTKHEQHHHHKHHKLW